MLFLSSKLTGKSVTVFVDDDNSSYDGVVTAVYEGWLELEADGETLFLNSRHISCIEVEKSAQAEPVRMRDLFRKKKSEEDL